MTGLRPQYPIATERLLLRPHRPDDLEDLLAFHGDPDVVRYLPWPVRDREATAAALRPKLAQGVLTEPGQWLVLAVELRETASVIGEVLLKWAGDEHRQGELGFAFGRAHHGRGLAAEAAAEMLRLGFDELGLHRITAVCIAENTASARLLERLGFDLEGRLGDTIHVKGQWRTQLLYALREEDWRAGATAAADLAEIRDLVHTFFEAFTSDERVAERLADLPSVLLPEARIVRTCGGEPVSYDVASFIAPRQTLLTDGSLRDFSERADGGRIDLFGDVAHWFGRYSKNGVLAGADYRGSGMKSLQFVRTSAGWRISAAAWDDARDGVDRHRAGS